VPVILWVVILTDNRYSRKRLWEVFLAREQGIRHFAVYTGHLGVVWPTGTVGYLCKDDLPKYRVYQKLSIDYLVNTVYSNELGRRLQEQEDIEIWQATLLILDCTDIALI
jgi:hypothetical protein